MLKEAAKGRFFAYLNIQNGCWELVFYIREEQTMIEIYLLEQLDAFAKYGTLSKAAEKLHVKMLEIGRTF